MSTITITLTDISEGQGVSVQADGGTPRLGHARTRAETLAMELLHQCWRQASSMHYGRAASHPGECVMGSAPIPPTPSTTPTQEHPAS